MDKTEFTKSFASELRKIHSEAKIKIPRDLEVFVELDGEEYVKYLGNAYSEYEADPSDLEDNFYRHIKSLFEIPEDGVREDIMPIIKGTAFLKDVRETQKDMDSPIVHETLNKELTIFYAFDEEQSLSYLKQNDLVRLNLNRKELRDIALANLKTKVPEIKSKGDAGFYMLEADGTYEASLLLQDDLWTSYFFPVDGDIVVSVLARDLVLVTGSKDRPNIEKLINIISREKSNVSYLVTTSLFKWVKGEWKIFKP